MANPTTSTLAKMPKKKSVIFKILNYVINVLLIIFSIIANGFSLLLFWILLYNALLNNYKVPMPNEFQNSSGVYNPTFWLIIFGLISCFVWQLIMFVRWIKKSIIKTNANKLKVVILAVNCLVIILLLLLNFSRRDGSWLFRSDNAYNDIGLGKPVIYLYPEKTENVQVKLDFNGKFIADYPLYDYNLHGWQVTARPNGQLINQADGKEYSYLFWEGLPNKPVNWDLSSGFVVPGADTAKFLQATLVKIGLTPKEYNEFIVYWYPKMQNNSYNLITFAQKQYTDLAPLTISPQPNSLLRVFMVYKPLQEKIDVQPQVFTPFVRHGFTVVEWGGTEIK